MRKELSIYIPTIERGEELLLQRVHKNTEFVLLALPQGEKVAVKRADLVAALFELNYHYNDTNGAKQETPTLELVATLTPTLEFGVEDE